MWKSDEVLVHIYAKILKLATGSQSFKHHYIFGSACSCFVFLVAKQDFNHNKNSVSNIDEQYFSA